MNEYGHMKFWPRRLISPFFIHGSGYWRSLCVLPVLSQLVIVAGMEFLCYYHVFYQYFQCEMVFDNDRNLTYSCQYIPSMEGEYTVSTQCYHQAQDTCVSIQDICVSIQDTIMCINTGYMCINTGYMCINTGYMCINTWYMCINTGYMCINTLSFFDILTAGSNLSACWCWVAHYIFL